ncbi:MAG: PqqD family protein [Solobacterium sp.]|nr:PqqD family protein [Solobacterium sp.]
MKLNRNFIVHRSEQETILVPAGGTAFSGIIRGNEIFGDILALLEKEISEADLLKGMTEIYDAPAEVLQKDITRVLRELREAGALDE